MVNEYQAIVIICKRLLLAVENIEIINIVEHITTVAHIETVRIIETIENIKIVENIETVKNIETVFEYRYLRCNMLLPVTRLATCNLNSPI